MCVVCGCGDSDDHSHEHGHTHDHDHTHGSLDLHFGHGIARVSVPGLSQERTLQLETKVLDENDRIAARNRAHLEAHGVLAVNLVSSPGSGKTTLLCATIARLRKLGPTFSVGVIEGDQQTTLDADRIRAAGAPAVQVNTGKGCHLDAQMVAEAFSKLPLHAHAHHDHHHHHEARGLLFIENVGNLVCPALWDLGERAKIAILSVTEGEDKPLKYPDMFAAARLLLVNKVDLLPYVQFDVTKCYEYARRINPAIEMIEVSATRGDGLDAFVAWLQREAATLAG